MFDGLSINKDFVLTENHLREYEQVVFDKSGFNLELVSKSTDTNWKPM